MAKDYRTYSEKLRDPRWQRVRLEVLNRDGWECGDCGSKDKTLNVHHTFYRKNADPWDYPTGSLRALCEDCHKESHGLLDECKTILGSFGVGDLHQALGYLQGMKRNQGGQRLDDRVHLRNYEHVEGMAHAYTVTGGAERLVSLLVGDEDGECSFVTIETLNNEESATRRRWREGWS